MSAGRQSSRRKRMTDAPEVQAGAAADSTGISGRCQSDAEIPVGCLASMNPDWHAPWLPGVELGLITALITVKSRDPQRGGTRVRTPAPMPLDCVLPNQQFPRTDIDGDARPGARRKGWFLPVPAPRNPHDPGRNKHNKLTVFWLTSSYMWRRPATAMADCGNGASGACRRKAGWGTRMPRSAARPETATP